MVDITSQEIKIQDLPKQLSVDLSAATTRDEYIKVIESLKAQILYSSRFDLDETNIPEIEIKECQRQGNLVTFDIKVANRTVAA